jgi:O-antigen ligase
MPRLNTSLNPSPSFTGFEDRGMQMETVQRWDRVLDRLIFGGVCVELTAAPWLFGAWEMWWFWIFATGWALIAALFGLRLMACAVLGTRHLRSPRPFRALFAAYALFLGYAFIRALQADVRIDAERSFLLHLTAGLVVAPILMGFSARQIRWLAGLLAFNLIALGAYGVANHFLTGNARVLWMPGYEQYQQGHARATGSYYCPDHFAGILEIGLAFSLAVGLVRGAPRGLKALGWPLAGVALAGILFSKSRGAGLTVVVMGLGFMVFGLGQYRPLVRWTLRGILLAGLLAGSVWIGGADHPYAVRFRQYPWSQLQHSDRGIMIAGALRAWQQKPVWGIGPGQHGHWWAHVAASGDGDRAAGRWPSRLNYQFHSYEVHSDWVQLLEEYGAVGLVLFLLMVGCGVKTLWATIRREARACARSGWIETEYPDLWAPVAALGVVVAMGFHSLGDFNLQMPATVWTTAAFIAMGLAAGFPVSRAGRG